MLDAAALQCDGCRRPLRLGTRFCPGCGQNVDGSAPTPQRRAEDDTIVQKKRFTEHWGELKRVAWLYGLLLSMSLVFGWTMRADPSPWPLVAFGAVDAAIVLLFAATRWQKLAFLFKVHAIGMRRWMEILGAAIAFVVVMHLYFGFLSSLGVPMIQSTEAVMEAGWPIWTAFVLVSVMPAVFEELGFRGVIQSSLERIFNARDAWLIQAALFSLLHLSPLVFPSHFAMGLAFGWMRMRSRSLYPSILLHAAWNALVVFQELF
jgi:membrane protease YdiL (CAAX protease family)